jgi:hypothetical protein
MCEKQMPDPCKVIAFDVDAASLAKLREALPGWQINDIYGATVGSLPCDWDPGVADLLVVGVRENVAETLGLCRFLAFCSSYSIESRKEADKTFVMSGSLQDPGPRPDAPLLVLVPPGQENLMEAALKAGAHSCLVLPIHALEVANMLRQARAGKPPSRRTLNLELAQSEDRWRDDGGQG